MRKQAKATEDTAPGIIPAAPWRVASLQALTGYCLRVRFADGTEGTVDVSRLIMGKDAGVFARLRDPELFASTAEP